LITVVTAPRAAARQRPRSIRHTGSRAVMKAALDPYIDQMFGYRLP
jgi:hypothetical protein